MNKRLVFKLLPIALVAAVGIFFGATTTPKADAVVSSLTPATFTATSGVATTFSFIADNSGGISVSASSVGATVALSASCTGCSVSSSGGASLTITPAVGSVANVVGVSLTCTNITVSSASIVLTVTQGNSMSSTGVCVSSVSCVNVLLSGCCDGISFTNCGCLGGLNTSSLLLNNGLGCNNCFGSGFNNSLFLNNGINGINGLGINGLGCNTGCIGGLGSVTLGSQLLNTGCGCFNGFNSSALTLNNCGCVNGFQSTGLLANCGCVGGVSGGLILAGNNFVNNGNCTASQVSVTVPGSATCGSTTNVLVSVRNTITGIPLDGTPVVVSSTMGTVTPTQTFTSGGIASATLLLPANAAGTATITAAAAGLTGQASIVVSCNVTPVAPAPIVQPIAISPIPVVITGPNTGDGGCFVVACN